jgi:hypothetical protein
MTSITFSGRKPQPTVMIGRAAARAFAATRLFQLVSERYEKRLYHPAPSKNGYGDKGAICASVRAGDAW